jgi:hypothetical protein
MRLRGKKSPLHFDDHVWSAKKERRPRPGDIEIVVKESALRTGILNNAEGSVPRVFHTQKRIPPFLLLRASFIG